MRRLALVAALFVQAASPAAKEAKVLDPAAEIRRLARFTAPKGWAESVDRIGGDPVLAFAKYPYTLRVQLLGGRGSRHESPQRFLASLEAKDSEGKPAREARRQDVAGKPMPVYVRAYDIRMADHHGSGPEPAERVLEEFCVVPAGSRFFLLSYSASSLTEPDLKPGAKAWNSFLSGFRLLKP